MQQRDTSLLDEAWAAAKDSAIASTVFGIGATVTATNTVAVSTADTFVDADVNVLANTIALPTHGWVTGRKVAATTTGTLPGGLSATDYYVIKVDADTIKLASSASNALLGTAVDITSAAGGGTHTLTPAALSGASIKLQWSNDGTNWFDVAGSSTNVTVTGTLSWTLSGTTAPYYKKLKAVCAISAGQVLSDIDTTVLQYR